VTKPIMVLKTRQGFEVKVFDECYQDAHFLYLS